MKFNSAIIDLDPLVYRCGFSIEKYDKENEVLNVEPVHHAFYNINSMMKKILDRTQASNYTGYLTSSDKSNFRFEVYPEYKSNRKDARKPVYYKEIRKFLENKWDGIMISGQEADDACSIKQYELNTMGFDQEVTNSILCSFDKDFNNIPGWHYNFIKDEIYYVNETEALQNFYLQILTGDTSDGIPRIKKGWRQKEIENCIKVSEDEFSMLAHVYDEVAKVLFNKQDLLTNEEKDAIIKEITWRGQLVWLRRKPEEMWLPNI